MDLGELLSFQKMQINSVFLSRLKQLPLIEQIMGTPPLTIGSQVLVLSLNKAKETLHLLEPLLMLGLQPLKQERLRLRVIQMYIRHL